MLALNAHRGLSTTSRWRVHPQTCLHRNSVDKTGFHHPGETHPRGALDPAPHRAMEAQILGETRMCRQSYPHNADGHLWSLNHHHYRSAVLSALTLTQRRSTLQQQPRRPHWKFRHEGGLKTFPKDSSLRLEMDPRLHRSTRGHHNPHHLRRYPFRHHHHHHLLQWCRS